jgi:hypothetical protein
MRMHEVDHGAEAENGSEKSEPFPSTECSNSDGHDSPSTNAPRVRTRLASENHHLREVCQIHR